MNVKNNSSSQTDSVVNLVSRLMEEQKISWPLLRENYSALSNIKTKSFRFEGFDIKAQFNPARIISSSANVTKEVIEKRPCFLCENNLPAEQQKLGINNFYVLCNPYPIFNEHFTIAKTVHSLQSIWDNFDELLSITKMLGKKYTLLYNGPACGASAPDHMHFQAVTNHVIPIEDVLCNSAYQCSKEEVSDNETEVSFIQDDLRKFVVLSTQVKTGLISTFNKFYSSYKTITAADGEPMMNIICWFRDKKWNVVIFPRRVHRPSQFFLNDENRSLISPAVVDLGGLLIIPREYDFNKITLQEILDIYRQVAVSKDVFQNLYDAFKKLLKS